MTKKVTLPIRFREKFYIINFQERSLQPEKGAIFAFIDSQNLNLSVKDDIYHKGSGKLIYSGWSLDFKKFSVYLKDKYNVSKAFLFIGKKPGNEGLYRYLKRAGYQLVYKPTITSKNPNKELTIKGNVDAELVLHAMIEYDNYDRAIIVAGDGDYHCLVEYLHDNNKLEKIFIPNRYSYSSLLRGYRNYFAYVSDLRKKLEKK